MLIAKSLQVIKQLELWTRIIFAAFHFIEEAKKQSLQPVVGLGYLFAVERLLSLKTHLLAHRIQPL